MFSEALRNARSDIHNAVSREGYEAIMKNVGFITRTPAIVVKPVNESSPSAGSTERVMKIVRGLGYSKFAREANTVTIMEEDVK